MEKTCCHFIEKHENNLPFSDFNESVDRYQLLMDVLEGELKLQYQKLKLMEAYWGILKVTAQQEVIYKLSERILAVKHKEYIIDLNKRYFRDSFED